MFPVLLLTQIACLLETPKYIKVTNVCPIPAEIKCTLRHKDSYFKLRQRSLTLAPGTCEMLEVIAVFNEPTEVQDLLMISVTEGSDLALTLRGQVSTRKEKRHIAEVQSPLAYPNHVQSFKLMSSHDLP